MKPHRHVVTDVDACLGPAEGRFFGSGYRRVTRELSEVVLRAMSLGDSIEACARVHYPVDWSCKAAGELAPHLSSIDAALIAIDLAELYVSHGERFDGDARRRSWISELALTAGSRPTDVRTAFPCSLHAAEGGSRENGHFRTRFDGRIGSIRVRLEIEHDVALPPLPQTGRTVVDASVLGTDGSRYFSTGYRNRRQTISQLVVDVERRAAAANLIVSGDTCRSDTGLGGAYQPTVSVIEIIVSLAQLAQVVLYQADDLPRQHSNTLWMRGIWLTAHTPSHPLDAPIPIRVGTRRWDQVQMDSRTWRLAEFYGSLPGVDVGARLAHALPERVSLGEFDQVAP